jgi:hypothetical protein
MRRIEQFMERGSRIAWSSAEFQAIAELLGASAPWSRNRASASEPLQHVASPAGAYFGSSALIASDAGPRIVDDASKSPCGQASRRSPFRRRDFASSTVIWETDFRGTETRGCIRGQGATTPLKWPPQTTL